MSFINTGKLLKRDIVCNKCNAPKVEKKERKLRREKQKDKK